jgi:hypothetical protein
MQEDDLVTIEVVEQDDDEEENWADIGVDIEDFMDGIPVARDDLMA